MACFGEMAPDVMGCILVHSTLSSMSLSHKSLMIQPAPRMINEPVWIQNHYITLHIRHPGYQCTKLVQVLIRIHPIALTRPRRLYILPLLLFQ